MVILFLSINEKVAEPRKQGQGHWMYARLKQLKHKASCMQTPKHEESMTFTL